MTLSVNSTPVVIRPRVITPTWHTLVSRPETKSGVGTSGQPEASLLLIASEWKISESQSKFIQKSEKIRNLAQYQKLKKMAISQNRSHLFDTRPLKKEGHDKLRNYLAPLPWKALDAIISGEDLPKGIKLCHLEPVIRFLITELGWVGIRRLSGTM